MRILFISNLFPPDFRGGYEIECAQVAEGLLERGHEIFILTTESQNKETSSFSVLRNLKLFQPFSHSIYGSLHLRFLKRAVREKNYQESLKAIKKIKPDVVYLWSLLRVGMSPPRAVMDLQVPMVWRLGDEYLIGYKSSTGSFSLKEKIKSFIDSTFFKADTCEGLDFRYVSCISESTREKVISHNIPIYNSEIIRKGIPTDQFPIKNNPGIIEPPISLLYVGQLHPYKGVKTIIEAIGILENKYEINLTIIGKGDTLYEKELRTLANQMNSSINFTGKIEYNQLGKYYHQHDILIFPSIWEEPQGTSYLEAMSCGLPVISTKVGGVSEILIDNENALIFEKGNPKSLALKIEFLINNHELRKKVIYEGKKMVESEFTMEKYLDKTEKILHNCKKGIVSN